MKEKFLGKISKLFLILAVLGPALLIRPLPAMAAANLYLSATQSPRLGDNVTISVYVNTGGQAANAFEGTISYSTSLFDGVRGTFSGGICSLPVVQPDPSGGSATFSCGTPSGYTGTGLVATIILMAKASGAASLGLSGCQVLANDGLGTDITGGCSGTSTTILAAGSTPVPTATPTPTPTPSTPTPTPTATPTPTPTPTATPTPTPTPTAASTATPTPTSRTKTPTPTPKNAITKPTQDLKPAENPDGAPPPTANPTPPPAEVLPSSTPTPTPTPNPALEEEEEEAATSVEKRTISGAFRDMFEAVKKFRLNSKDFSSLIALILSLIPFIILCLAVAYAIYRLYLLERKKRRAMDRLFELELSELAALEGKMDLLAEKGSKGREQYRQEFQATKAKILRQLKPDFGRPMETLKAAGVESKEENPEKQPPEESK